MIQHHSQFLIFAQIQILAEFALHALLVHVQVGQFALLVAPLHFRHGHAFLIQKSLEIFHLLGHLLDFQVACGKFLLDFFLGFHGGAGFTQDAFGIHHTNAEILGHCMATSNRQQ